MMAAGYVHEGKRFVTIAIGCTGGKHRSTAIAEEFGTPAARAGDADQGAAPRRRSRMSLEHDRTRTGGGSHGGAPHWPAPAAGGGGVRRWARAGRLPHRPAADHRPADRRGHRRRRRRFVGPAPRRAQLPAARRPADGVGRALRRRRVRPDLGRRAAVPVPGDGPAWPTTPSATCSSPVCGTGSAIPSPGWTWWPGCWAPRAGCCRWRRYRWRSRRR